MFDRFVKLATVVTVITLTSAHPSLAKDGKLNVVASFSIIGDLAKNVGGDRIVLTTLVGPDGDAHVYEPRPSDAALVSKADVVLVNGLHFEGFLGRLVEASGTRAPLVELSKGAEVLKSAEEHDHEGESEHTAEDGHHHHGEFDPHAWQSVHNAEIYVKNITEAFCQADAEGCDAYNANSRNYLEQLRTLDPEIRTAIDSIPQDRRVVITSHDAFGYFAHEYGLTFLAPEGVSTDAEASASDVAALIRQVREDKAAAVFVENITNQKLIEQISSETGIAIGGSLYSDALSGSTGPAATYIDMMRHNVRTIKGAIGGS